MNGEILFLKLRAKINSLEPQARDVFFSFVCTEEGIDNLGRDAIESMLVTLGKISDKKPERKPCVETTGRLSGEELAKYHYLMSFLDQGERDKIEDRIKSTGSKTLSEMPRPMYNEFINEYPDPVFSNSDVEVPRTANFAPQLPAPDDFKGISHPTIRLKQVNTLVVPDNIPPVLMRETSWCNWTLTAKCGTQGVVKAQKIPTNTRTGRFLKASEMDQLANYGEAVNYLWSNISRVSGVSYVLRSPQTGVVGIDLDNCIRRDGDNTHLSCLALRVLSSFSDTYCEVSPSGEGIRIFCIGQLPPKEKRLVKVECPETGYPEQIIEMYDFSSVKPFTMTGARFEFACDGDVHFTPHSLLWLLNEFFVKPQSDTPPLETRSCVQKERSQDDARNFDNTTPLTDDDILAIISKASNATKFQDLYDGGLGGKSDASKADASFCSILSFYTQSSRGGGMRQIDSIFRRSRRMRKKWDEKHYSNGKTYGEGLLDFATRNMRSVYKGREEG